MENFGQGVAEFTNSLRKGNKSSRSVEDFAGAAESRLAMSRAKYGDGGNWGGDGFGKYQGNLIDEISSIKGARSAEFKTFDIDSHGLLKKQSNRAAGHKNIFEDDFVQSHHIIQDAWAKKNTRGYKTDDAPAILLKSSSGEPHAIISALQRRRRNERVIEGMEPFNGPPISQQFANSYRDLIDSGISSKISRKAIKKAYKYFDSIGGFNE